MIGWSGIVEWKATQDGVRYRLRVTGIEAPFKVESHHHARAWLDELGCESEGLRARVGEFFSSSARGPLLFVPADHPWPDEPWVRVVVPREFVQPAPLMLKPEVVLPKMVDALGPVPKTFELEKLPIRIGLRGVR